MKEQEPLKSKLEQKDELELTTELYQELEQKFVDFLEDYATDPKLNLYADLLAEALGNFKKTGKLPNSKVVKDLFPLFWQQVGLHREHKPHNCGVAGLIK